VMDVSESLREVAQLVAVGRSWLRELNFATAQALNEERCFLLFLFILKS